MAVISKGITLSYINDSVTVALSNLMEIPELGGDVEAIEITTLDDNGHKYTDGIKNYGDGLAFKFLYESAQFATLQNLNNNPVNWIVKLPDNVTYLFTGTCSVKLDGVGVNAALTYTLTIKPTSSMTWSIPAGTEATAEA